MQNKFEDVVFEHRALCIWQNGKGLSIVIGVEVCKLCGTQKLFSLSRLEHFV